MKKVVLLVLALVLVGAVALAEVDLSGMTFDELVALKEQINLAIWKCQEWQEVTVPIGVWEVGKDIPAGHWTLTAADGCSMSELEVGTALDETNKGIDIMRSRYWHVESIDVGDPNTPQEIDYEFKDGDYVLINYGPMVFTPYNGKPSLGFK